MKHPRLFVIIVLSILIAGSTIAGIHSSVAASPADFSSASNAIDSAYVSVHSAEESGGNVSSLVNQLDSALALVQRAQSENATNPSQATLDLQNATQIAQKVALESSSVAQGGASAVRVRTEESIGSVVAIIVAAALIYIYGGKIYRRAWLYVYRDFTVRPLDE